MKIIFIAISLMVVTTCSAQIGLITLDKKAKEVPIGQWFTYAQKEWNNSVIYLNHTEEVHKKLNEILEENEIFFEDYKIDAEGDKYWKFIQKNGYLSYVYLVSDDEGWMRIIVNTEN
jgi:hypothetical protein